MLALLLAAMVAAAPTTDQPLRCVEVVTSSRSTTYVPASSSTTAIGLVGWGYRVEITGLLYDGHACYLQAPGASIGVQGGGAGTVVTDGSSSGFGACVPWVVGSGRVDVVRQLTTRGVIGARTGVCSAPAQAQLGGIVWPPCSTLADCISFGTGHTYGGVAVRCLSSPTSETLQNTGAAIALRSRGGPDLVTVCVGTP